MSATHSFAVVLCLMGAGLRAEPKLKITTAADCTFSANPGTFLNRESRIRQSVLDNTAKMPRLRPASAVSAASLPQHNFIDQEVFGKLASSNVPAAGLSSDAEFVRRIYLDLTGRIPKAAAVRAFLADGSTGRRDQLIDKLLASSEFTDRWTMWLGDLLQNSSVSSTAAISRGVAGRNAFYSYLYEAVANDTPVATIATDVLTGQGNNLDAANRAANFPIGASTDMGPIQDNYDMMLTKSAAMFLGLGHYDCLLCHNGRGHLNGVSLWGVSQTRVQAQSMAAFFSRLGLAVINYPPNSIRVMDNADGAYNLNTDSGNRPPRTPIGDVKVLTPEYRETGATPPPNSNWRSAFAASMTQDPMFSINLANRIWKQMFSLALAEPVDNLDPARLDSRNPPPEGWDFQASHPVLLEKLAAEFVNQGFRLRPLLRTIARSSAYQLSSSYGSGWKLSYFTLFARHYPRRLEGEEVADAIAQATEMPGGYYPQGMTEPVQWAMQLPEPTEPKSDGVALTFLNTFLRGNRDTQARRQDGSVQQQLSLMNDPFVAGRVQTARSARLAAIPQIARDEDMVDEVFLTFLSRYPAAVERESALRYVANAASRAVAVEDLAWMCINKIDFLFSY